MKKLYLAGLICLTSFAANASEVEFSYNPDGFPTMRYGYDRAETYDVAIFLNDPSLLGSTIKEIKVPFAETEGISEVSVWASSELNLKKKNGKNVNDPDIMSQEVEISGEGDLSVTLDEPLLISGPLYVGYSFTVDELTEETSYPVIIAETVNPNGLFIHSSRTKLKWMNVSEDAGGVSAMSLVISGEFSDDSAAFQYQEGLYVSVEETAIVPLKVINHGTNPIESISYTYTSGQGDGNGTVEFETPVSGVFGASGTIEINLGEMKEAGLVEITLTVTKVNGKDNNDPTPTTIIPFKVYPFLPVNRPLVEEYTGLWCGWCVRGYVALETMRELYPNDFIALAYHDGDPMETNLERPRVVNSYPKAYINRGEELAIQNIYTIWPEFIKKIAPAAIDVNVEWTDETHTAIKAVASTRFIDNYDNADFSICYALVEDGMSDPSWGQSNAYAPEKGEEPKPHPEMPGDLGEMFTSGESIMYGLVYNDVILALPQPHGYPGSVPKKISLGETYTHSCIISLEDIENIYGDYPIQDTSKLRIVATILDNTTGRAINSNTSAYVTDGESGVAEINNENKVETARFNFTGMPVDDTYRGMVIITYSDGSAKKVLVN